MIVNNNWYRGAFPDETSHGLSKMEYAAIQIFAMAIANRAKLFSDPECEKMTDEIANIVHDIATSSWKFANQLKIIGEDLVESKDI
jgi:hypothetical protein